jgi:hypothetical protein
MRMRLVSRSSTLFCSHKENDVFRYTPPGGIDDLEGRPKRKAFLDDWHEFVHGQFRANLDRLQDPRDENGVAFDTPIPDPLFFSEVDDAATSGDLPVTWSAFPLGLMRRNGQNQTAAWAAADVLQSTTQFSPPGETATTRFRPQDEYCEWHVYRNAATKKIERVVFTAEAPEYWIRLAEHDVAAVLALYQKHVSTKVKKADLLLDRDIEFGTRTLSKGGYNPFNPWNTENGIVHLTHAANTIGAQINLAARATALRKNASGTRITDARRLICCSGFGSCNRSSDPSIGQGVNITARGAGAADRPLRITLANPVGLYMNQLTGGTLTDDKGKPLDNWFTFARGKAGRGLMAVVRPPKSAKIGFDALQVKGVPFTRAGQIAEALQMVLYAKTAPFTGAAPPLAPCVFHCCVPSATAAASLKDVILFQDATDDSCADRGAGSTPPVAMKDAYPELVPAVSPVGAHAPLARVPRRYTRLA